jgi:hypothetical protein
MGNDGKGKRGVPIPGGMMARQWSKRFSAKPHAKEALGKAGGWLPLFTSQFIANTLPALP